MAGWISIATGKPVNVREPDKVTVPETGESTDEIHTTVLVTYERGDDGFEGALERNMLYRGYMKAEETD